MNMESSLTAEMCGAKFRIMQTQWTRFVKILLGLIEFCWTELFYLSLYNTYRPTLMCFDKYDKKQTNKQTKFASAYWKRLAGRLYRLQTSEDANSIQVRGSFGALTYHWTQKPQHQQICPLFSWSHPTLNWNTIRFRFSVQDSSHKPQQEVWQLRILKNARSTTNINRNCVF